MKVQFSFPAKGISIVKAYSTPKRVSEIDYWLKKARKIIPEIPQTVGENPEGWALAYQHATPTWVDFTFLNTAGERCFVNIDRLASSLG